MAPRPGEGYELRMKLEILMARRLVLGVIALAAISGSEMPLLAQSPAGPAEPEWRSAEAPLLTRHVQLTTRQQFAKAGEAYFSPDGQWIIFQGTPASEGGAEPDPFYSMYVGRLVRDGQGHVTGLAEITRVSPVGSANTCGWFDPIDPTRVIFGSTRVKPTEEKSSGFQVGSRRYVWQFPAEMDVVRASPFGPAPTEGSRGRGGVREGSALEPLISRPNYDAECSYSSDGRWLLYSHVEDRPADLAPDAPYRPDANIYILDTKTGEQIPLVTASGYDGGPFFSPDGRQICYRSDRKGDDLLQLFVADLAFGADGVPTGIAREYQLTDNGDVNWAPYWHPSGAFLVYASSEVGHQNYEVFGVEVDRAKLEAAAKGAAPGSTVNAANARRARITNAIGADVLPSFSPDGTLMMWTCQRGPLFTGETKPSSQLWIAEWNGTPEFKESAPAGKPNQP